MKAVHSNKCCWTKQVVVVMNDRHYFKSNYKVNLHDQDSHIKKTRHQIEQHYSAHVPVATLAQGVNCS